MQHLLLNKASTGESLLAGLAERMTKGPESRPADGKRLIYLVEDLNLPERTPYADTMALNLLKHYASYQEWYSLSLQLTKVRGTQLLATMTPAARCFEAEARLMWRLAAFSLEEPCQQSFTQITGALLPGLKA